MKSIIPLPMKMIRLASRSLLAFRSPLAAKMTNTQNQKKRTTKNGTISTKSVEARVTFEDTHHEDRNQIRRLRTQHPSVDHDVLIRANLGTHLIEDIPEARHNVILGRNLPIVRVTTILDTVYLIDHRQRPLQHICLPRGVKGL